VYVKQYLCLQLNKFNYTIKCLIALLKPKLLSRSKGSHSIRPKLSFLRSNACQDLYLCYFCVGSAVPRLSCSTVQLFNCSMAQWLLFEFGFRTCGCFWPHKKSSDLSGHRSTRIALAMCVCRLSDMWHIVNAYCPTIICINSDSELELQSQKCNNCVDKHCCYKFSGMKRGAKERASISVLVSWLQISDSKLQLVKIGLIKGARRLWHMKII